MNYSNILFGLMCKTQNGRQRLSGGIEQLLPSTFPRNISKWWLNCADGLAMYQPSLDFIKGTSQHSALTTVGMLYPPALNDALVNEKVSWSAINSLHKLKGEFAIAFWNAKQGELLLARDHFGQRTIFVREDEDFYFYCSELHPLLADDAFRCQLDFESAYQYLAFGQPVPGRTLARQITRVPAAHCLTWRPQRPLFKQRYYTPLRHDACKVNDDFNRGRIQRTLDLAIQDRIRPGKQALLLSGGVDSSYIAATLPQYSDAGSLTAYTVAFSEVGVDNEVDYAQLVAKQFGIRHRVVTLDVNEAAIHLKHILSAAEPCSAWASITHQHLLSRISNDGHKHLFSGLGSDEVFGGYGAFLRHYKLLRLHKKAWAIQELVDSIDGLMQDPRRSRSRLFTGVPRFFEEPSLRKGLHPPFCSWNSITHDISFYRECRSLKFDSHIFELMVAHECQHRIPDLLFVDFETISRHNGICTVYPFLDPELVALATALGATERFYLVNRRWSNKKAFREIAALRIPQIISSRKPVSYNAPFLVWMAQPRFAKQFISDLHNSSFWKAGLVKRAWLQRIESEVKRSLSNPKGARLNCAFQLWAILTLAAWHDRWIKA